MAGRDEFWRPSERPGEIGDAADAGRVAPGRRTLTQTIGGSPGPGATATPGKIALTHRIPSATPMALPYRGEMEAGFGQDFSGVSAVTTTSEALGGAGGMAQGETVAFAGTPSKHTVAHELAHVVQHRQGVTGGEAHADTGVALVDKAAEAMAALAARSQARLPSPLVVEIIGDRFNVSYEVNHKNELVFKVQYVGPYQVGGDKVQDRALKIATPRAEGQSGGPLNVSVVTVSPRGAMFDLTGGGTELAELTFDSQPHESDGNARTHFLDSKTGNKAGESGRAIFRFDILLPSATRPAPDGVEAGQVEQEKAVSAQVALGPDAFTLVARRFGESNKVHLHFEGVGSVGEHQNGNGNLLIPVAAAAGPIGLDILEQAPGSILLDLDGDGRADARLVHTAGVGDPGSDGTQEHLHYIDAYDPNKVKLAHAFFKVRGPPWEVPAAIDNLKNPPPDGAVPPASQAPAQGNLPTEGSQSIQLPGKTDWELRLDADGDRQKELLLRFHQRESGAPVDITAVQVSTQESSSFSVGTLDSQNPSFMDPVVSDAADGVHATGVRLFSRGYHVHIDIAPPVDDAEGRTYAFSAVAPGGPVDHLARFKKEVQTASKLATDPKANQAVANIRAVTVRMGELGDPFLFTLEWVRGGWTFGIAGLNPDGSPGSTSGHRLSAIEVKGMDIVDVTPTQVGVDLDNDQKPDIVIHDGIGQEVGPHSSRQLIVARYHQMSLSGPAVANGASRARFQLRGRNFVPTAEPGDVNREGAGAAAAVTGIGAQDKEGSSVKTLIGRFRAGVSAQILRAGEKGLLSGALVSAWKSLSEEMIRLDAISQATNKTPELAKAEADLRRDASAHAATVFAELKAATANEIERSMKDTSGVLWENPYTETIYLKDGPDVDTFTEHEASPSAGLSNAIAEGNDAAAAQMWVQLQGGLERWAQEKIERELGRDSPLAQQGRYMSTMAEKLTEIQDKKNVQRVSATYIADESHRKEQGFFETLPLQLWVWQDEDGETWHIRDLTNPEKPFNESAKPEYKRVCNPAVDRPPSVPPHSLFQRLNDRDKYPKGIIRYQVPGTHWADQVVCTADKKWYDWVQEIGLGLAIVGLTLTTFGTGTIALVGSYALAASALAGAVAAGGTIADAAEHGWLDGMTLAVNLLQIVAGVASAGAIVAGNLIRGARAASAAVEAGTEGAALWTGRLAKLAAMADKAYVPLTAGALAADVTSVVVMAVDLKNKLDEIDKAGLPEEKATEAKIKLLSMAALTGGLTLLSIKGDLPDIRSHGSKGPTIVLDQVNGVPVAYAGGVRLGKTEFNVSPRLGPDGKPVVDPNLHASARWQNRDATAKGLSEEEVPWYQAWMEQKEKVKFKPNGEPEIVMPKMEGKTPPTGLEDKLKGMVKTTDVALYDAAWARNAELDELRQANGGHLDIDPTSPIWPAERAKLKDKLARSLHSERKAEEMLSRYEQFRGGGGSGKVLHANQAAKLGQVIPPGEIDGLRKMFPECEVYVTGSPITEGGSTKIDSIDIVLVVPKGTPPDLMAAIEMRAAGVKLRPDPDYAKAHAPQGMNENSTLALNAKAVSSDQFFGLATAKIKGKPAVEFHRLDVPTDPSGRAYTQAELEAMNKAGYEYDTGTGTFKLRDAESRKGLVPSGAPRSLRGNNTVLGNPVPSEAVGQEVLRKLAMGDAEVFRVVGIDPPPGFDPRVKEWGLGQREDGAWVIVEGETAAVNWSKVPGVKPRGHVHPLEVRGQVRHLQGARGKMTISVEDLRNGTAPHNDVMALCPSGSDLAAAARDGRHMVATPYVHLGGGVIGNPTPGGLDVPIEFDILHATPIGVSGIGDTIVYKAYVKIKAGDQVLYEGPMWGSQVETPDIQFSEVSFKEPSYPLKPVPPDVPKGSWNLKGAGSGVGGADNLTGNNADELKKAMTSGVDERRKVLGTDPRNGYKEHEALVGAEIESRHGWFLRDPSGDAEWISLSGPDAGKTFDLCGFPTKAIPHVKVSEFTESIKHHMTKSATYIVVDIRGLPAQKKTDIKAYIAANHAAAGVYPSGKLLLLE